MTYRGRTFTLRITEREFDLLVALLGEEPEAQALLEKITTGWYGNAR